MSASKNPKIYHITHVKNLPSIVKEGLLLPDSEMAKRKDSTVIGNQGIKNDRMHRPVACHSGTFVAQYVPFYFCPRSIMLYFIYKANNKKISYRGGQYEIVHIMADLKMVVEWASEQNKQWAFSDMNAAIKVANFFNDLNDINQLDWKSIRANRWDECTAHKAAEFLIKDGFPLHLTEGIGVYSPSVAAQTSAAFALSSHRPLVKVKTEWYY